MCIGIIELNNDCKSADSRIHLIVHFNYIQLFFAIINKEKQNNYVDFLLAFALFKICVQPIILLLRKTLKFYNRKIDNYSHIYE